VTPSGTPQPHEMTPQDRLALSRRAIFQCMTLAGDDGGELRQDGLQGAGSDTGYGPQGQQFKAGQTTALGRLWRALRRTTGRWWRHHPAHLVLEVAQPVLGRYAQAHPLKLLGVAAALGAAVVVLRPWRLIPVTGLLLAALKSKTFSHFIAAALLPEPGRGRDQTR
jgi:hypothetical protein